MTPHDDCQVCAYWQDRIGEWQARALAENEAAARRELDEHLKRTSGARTHLGAVEVAS